MVHLVRAMKFSAALLLAAVMLSGVSTASSAQTTGIVHLRIVKAGFILGAGGGQGTVTFHGATHRLKIGGVGIGTIGIAEARLIGVAYHMHHVTDIVGTYNAVGASVAVVGGPKVARLQNGKGVILELRGAATRLRGYSRPGRNDHKFAVAPRPSSQPLSKVRLLLSGLHGMTRTA